MGDNPGRRSMLVIGASGLVGGNLLHHSARYPYSIIPTFHEYVPEEYRATGLQLDITGPHVRKIVADLRPDCVVNLSCMGVTQSQGNPRRAREVHAEGVEGLARACREHHIRLVHFSTDMVYSGDKGSPYTLDDEPDPVSVYGQTKRAGEEAVQAAGGDYVILRCALVLGRGRFRRGGFLDWMVDKAEKGETLPLYVDQLRTPMVVDDLADVIFRLAASSYTGTLLAGGDEGFNRVEIGRKLLSSMGLSHELIQPIRAAEQKSPVPLQLDLRLDNAALKEVVVREKFMRIGDYMEKLFQK